MKQGPFADPIDAILAQTGECVLAVITAVQGSSYRPAGTLMAIFADRERAGQLSSGCVEDDIVIHAIATLAAGTPSTVHYGRGSQYMDIKLPCGGGIEVLLIPRPDRNVLQRVSNCRTARTACTLNIDLRSGQLSFVAREIADPLTGQFSVYFQPEIKFAVFGAEQEAAVFCDLVRSAGYPTVLYSPNEKTLDYCHQQGCETHRLLSRDFPASLTPDSRTAIILFFHDHDWEAKILAAALTGPAFYVGAQGSAQVAEKRFTELRAKGLDEKTISRLHGPVGIIPLARDARTLAVSVLAQVLSI